MNALIKSGLVISGYIIAFSVQAFEVAREFSAEAVQNIPGRSPTFVKMFVSKKAVRTESMVNGNMLVEIVFPDKNRRVLLDQARKTWTEQKTLPVKKDKNRKSKNSPCARMANAVCKKLGREKINGRSAVKWEMTMQRNGQKIKSLHWLDSKYHLPLREQFPDGTLSVMTLLGKEKINGRKTEKWRFSASRPDGKKVESLQWYDPALKMVIREALPGGYVRELRNIKIKKQKKSLFRVPKDYKKEEFPNLSQLPQQLERTR